MSTVTNCFLIGGTRVLARCAAQLVAAGVRVEGVFTDDPVAVDWATGHGVPVLDPRADLVAALTETPVDYLFSVVNFRILPGPVLALPKVAAINFHDGPLPRYSGSNVAAWALYEGAGRHAATWHVMTEAVDAGSVLLERWFPIRNHSTALSLTYEAAEVGIELFADLVPHVVARTLPEPIDTSDRERRFYLSSDRIAAGGLIHAGTSAAEAERIAKALDYGNFPNPLGVPALITAQGAVFARQVRLVPREGALPQTLVAAVTDTALTLSAPDADLLVSDFSGTDGSTLSGRAVAQRLGLAVGKPLPAAPPQVLAAIADAQAPLRRHENWWKKHLTDLRPAPLEAADFSAAGAHYSRYELAYVPRSRAETVSVVRAFLAVLAQRMEAPSFDFAWSTSAVRARAEQTHGLAVARVPVRFDAADADSLADRLDAAAARHGYATDLEVRLGLAHRPYGSDGPTFTRIMVLERAPDEEAATEADTEIALLCLRDGPPIVFVRETAMSADEALEFTERVEDVALGAMLPGVPVAPEPETTPAAPVEPAAATTGQPATVTGGERTDPATTGVPADTTTVAAPVADAAPEPVAHAAPEPVADDTERDPVSSVPTLLDLVAATVAAHPHAVAVRSGDREIDYATLDAWADAVAAHLWNQGVEAGSVVGLLTERGPDLVPAMLGILRTGAAFLPLDPNYPVERLSRYLEVAACDLILADHRSLAFGTTIGPAVLPIPTADGSALAVPPPVTGDDLAYVLFTSGSTGEPKGVEIGHTALANFLTGIGERLGSGPDDRMLAHTTVAFDISLLELLLPLTVGATVVLASREVARDPQRLADLIGEVTVAQATPSLWRLLLETGWTPAADLTVLSGGEALVPAVAERLHATARELWNLYGPTEATIWVSTHRVDRVGTFLPLGDALPGLDLHVLDDNLDPCGPDGVGELYLSGIGLARGYVNRPDRTAEVFLEHPRTGLRLYKTGDTVRLHADGAIEWLGRADSQVKVRGNRIEPAEIERVLATFPGVTAAAVIAVAFEGRGEPRLTAYLVAERTLVKAELDEFVGQRLPEYMVPDTYVRLDAMPLTDNGKIARRLLPEPTRHSIIRTGVPSVAPTEPPAPAHAVDTPEPVDAEAPTPAHAVDTPEPAVTEPPAERIARVLATVLGHDGFLVTDNFFDLGGDSANVTRAATALSAEFGVEVSPTALFATGTPERLADLLQPAGPVRVPQPEPATSVEEAVLAAAEAVVEAVPQPEPTPAADPNPLPTATDPTPAPAVPAAGPTPPPAGTIPDAGDPTRRDPAPVRPAAEPAGEEDALAVIGMACRFPGAATPDEFWANLAEGVVDVGDAPPGHRGWGHLWTDTDEVPTGWVDRIEYFDAARFKLTDREARRLDPLQRILLSVTDEALESCGHTSATLGTHTGVFVGTIASDFPEIVAGSVGAGDPHVATGTAVSMVANRLSHAFDWTGPSFAVDTACSSSLVALHQAAMHLRSGEIDAAVVGAANLVLTPTKTRSFLRNGMLSPSGQCRTFDDDADGYVRGEGCGVIVLKRLADAERDGDPILAVVRGAAVNHTGAAGFLTAPSSTAQQAVIRTALERAGIDATGVGYVEAHGTGTQLGDLIELEALQAALAGAGRGTVAVGSVKTNIGHLEPAAGVAGLIKTILALQAERIPPSANLTHPNRAFRFENSPLFVPDRLVPWSGPRVAGVSSFGFGGVNAHAVLTAAPTPTRVPAATGPGLLTLSAGSVDGLRVLAGRLVRLLRSPYCPPLAWLCVASRQRPAATYRLACVVDSVEQLDDKLMLFLARAEGTRNLYVGVAEPTGRTIAPFGGNPGRDTLDTAARRFVAGDSLTTEERAPVRFPTTPHEERYLWLEPQGELPSAERTALGGRPHAWTWREHPEAHEHVVLGDPTLPGSGYPGKVAEIVGRDRFTLRDLTFRATVRPPATLTAELHGSRISFRDGGGTVVCDVEVTEPETTEPTLTPPLNEAGFVPVDLDGMYRDFARNGLAYGPGFRCVQTLATAPGQAVGTLAGAAAGPGPVDVRLLDGAFQVALAACGAQGLYVPFTVERLTVSGRLSGTVRVYARRDRGSAPDAGLLTASLVVVDGDRPVLTAHGITWRRISTAPPTGRPGTTGGQDRAQPGSPANGTANGRVTASQNGHVPAVTGQVSASTAGYPVANTAAPSAEAVAGPTPPQASGPTGPQASGPTGPQAPGAAGPRPAGIPVNGGGNLTSALAAWIAEGLETDIETLELDRPLEAQGLDSMLAISLAQDIRSKLDVEIPVTLLLEVGTVENLAAELRDNYGVTSVPGASAVPSAPLPVDAPPAAATSPTAPPAAAVPMAVPSAAEVAVPVAVPAVSVVEPAPDRGDRHAMAIIGYDGVFPNAGSPDELWEILANQQDCLQEVPKSRWDIDDYYSEEAEPGTVYLRRAGFVDDLTTFDAPFFRISPAEAQWIDPQQRHLIQSAWRALEDAGLSGRLAGRSVGVFVGASYQHYRDMVVGDVVQTAAGLGNHNAILANRVSYFLDLVGPSMTIDTLCSSSLVALHTAVRSIRNGECDQAIVAGVHLGMSPQYFQLGSRLRSFSPTGASRAFDAGADGFVPGEGVVTVVVKPLVDAVRDGDRIRGVIRGSAVNHGGRTSGLTVPSSAAQSEVIVAALRDAGVSPDSIGMVEAHGTGTSLGDPIEVDGLSRAWRSFTSRTQFCAIGSLKSNIGHLEPAAGLAGVVKVLLALEGERIPPTLHVVRPNDHIRFEGSPFFVADRVVPWRRVVGVPRRAAVSAFGMGGVNAHVIVEEAPLPAERGPVPQESHIVRVSAASEDAVRRLAGAYAEALPRAGELGDVGFTANVGRASHRFRVAVSGGDRDVLVAGLSAVAAGDRPVGRLVNQPPVSVFLFTGQGSQYPDMGRGLYATEPVFRSAVDECADLLSGHGLSLMDLLFGSGRDDLVQTRFAQVGIAAVQVGLVRLLESWGVRPGLVVGHSVGELTAAWAAGVFSLSDLLRLVAVRGEVMQAQPSDGTMVVAFASPDEVTAVLDRFPGVEVAAFNGPRNVTLSGPTEAIDAFVAGSGLRTQRLSVSHAFHSAAMAGAVDPFTRAFAGITAHTPQVGFASTVTGGWHDTATVTDAQLWGSGIRQPVRFTQALDAVHAAGGRVFWEIGPQPVLVGLGRQALGTDGLTWLPTLRRDHTDQAQLHAAVSTFYSQGAGEVDWAGVHHGKGHRTTTIPTYPFDRRELRAPHARATTTARETTTARRPSEPEAAVPATADQAAGHPLFDRHYEH
ncbi:polyketide synthase [Micromonospora cathayae]|uniref:Amino acid adenylation domain-containing protein n=1 Tax=Micromonospora cathayae TaxID=3028804 RepID=A0ABY7ZNL5_9ACTN|nr:polyketide synthase [Micromonospora sp. HUAS 3]WDZ83564.1 amino acid adenylation domain-containing protein [Micromonospora sp. HUAS 3]